MNNRSINHTIIEFLSDLTDNGELIIQQNKHIRLTGIYGGKKRSFTLSCSPSSSYQKLMRSNLKRFIRSLDNQTPLTNTIF
jgi:hypothetical protein